MHEKVTEIKRSPETAPPRTVHEELTAFLQVVGGTVDSATSLLKEAPVVVEINVNQLKKDMIFYLRTILKHKVSHYMVSWEREGGTLSPQQRWGMLVSCEKYKHILYKIDNIATRVLTQY